MKRGIKSTLLILLMSGIVQTTWGNQAERILHRNLEERGVWTSISREFQRTPDGFIAIGCADGHLAAGDDIARHQLMQRAMQDALANVSRIFRARMEARAQTEQSLAQDDAAQRISLRMNSDTAIRLTGWHLREIQMIWEDEEAHFLSLAVAMQYSKDVANNLKTGLLRDFGAENPEISAWVESTDEDELVRREGPGYWTDTAGIAHPIGIGIAGIGGLQGMDSVQAIRLAGERARGHLEAVLLTEVERSESHQGTSEDTVTNGWELRESRNESRMQAKTKMRLVQGGEEIGVRFGTHPYTGETVAICVWTVNPRHLPANIRKHLGIPSADREVHRNVMPSRVRRSADEPIRCTPEY